jgi:hypothetical protein
MRILAKILLFPVMVALTLVVTVCRFISAFSGAVLAVLSGLLFLVGLATLTLLRDPRGSVISFVFAFLISPYGIPLFVDWLIDRLDDLKYAIRGI